jgi:hypothetical protein
MSIFANVGKIKEIYANMNGEKKKISSVWVNKDGNPVKVFNFVNGKTILQILFRRLLYHVFPDNARPPDIWRCQTACAERSISAAV